MSYSTHPYYILLSVRAVVTMLHWMKFKLRHTQLTITRKNDEDILTMTYPLLYLWDKFCETKIMNF